MLLMRIWDVGMLRFDAQWEGSLEQILGNNE